MTWPEKKYIRFLNDDSLISEVKLKVEKLVFLGVFFENSCLKENQQSEDVFLILNPQIENLKLSTETTRI